MGFPNFLPTAFLTTASPSLTLTLTLTQTLTLTLTLTIALTMTVLTFWSEMRWSEMQWAVAINTFTCRIYKIFLRKFEH